MDKKKTLKQETLEHYLGQKPNFSKVNENIKYYNLDSQNILNPKKYPEKRVLQVLDNVGINDELPRNRIPLTYARLITEKATAFSFAIPVKYLPKNDADRAGVDVINEVFEKNKINSKQIALSDSLYGSSICAEIWYIDNKADKVSYDNGKTSGYPIKVKVLDALKGEKFYPIFDNRGDMIAFIREYSIRVEGADKLQERVEVLVNDAIYIYAKTDENTGYKLIDSDTNLVGKILAIYGCQGTSDYETVKKVIDRLSALVSGVGDINDYNAAPILMISGLIKTLVQKGEKGGVLQLTEGADAKLLESSNNFKGVEFEVATLRRAMQELSQTPSLAFEDLKGITNISGKALTIMLTDALLKATRKQSFWLEYLHRRLSVVKAILKQYHSLNIDDTNVTVQLTNFEIKDFTDKVNDMVTLVGGKSLISRETGLRLLGLDIDVEEEIKKVEDAESRAFNFSSEF